MCKVPQLLLVLPHKHIGCTKHYVLHAGKLDSFCHCPFQLEVMLEDNLTLPSNGRLYSKVLNWVQHSLWENGDQLEQLMEEVSTRFLEHSPSSRCRTS